MTRYIQLLLLLPLSATAQEGPVPFAVFTEGSIVYQPQEGRSYPVYAGTHMPGQGELILQPSAKLEVIRGDRVVKATGPRRCGLDELFKAQPPATGFLRRFLDFVGKGIDQSVDRESLEQAYLRNQGNAQGNIEGYGDAGLAGLLPFGGTLYPEVTTFHWPQEPGAPSYRLRVVDSLTETVLVAVTTGDTLIQLDLPHIHLTAGRRYYWEVFPNAAPSTTPSRLGIQAPAVGGTRIYFTYRQQPRAELLKSVFDLPFYNETGSEALRNLMEAVALEEQDYLYAADRAYHQSLIQEPNNTFVRRNYAAFLARWNQRATAQQLISPR